MMVESVQFEQLRVREWYRGELHDRREIDGGDVQEGMMEDERLGFSQSTSEPRTSAIHDGCLG